MYTVVTLGDVVKPRVLASKAGKTVRSKRASSILGQPLRERLPLPGAAHNERCKPLTVRPFERLRLGFVPLVCVLVSGSISGKVVQVCLITLTPLRDKLLTGGEACRILVYWKHLCGNKVPQRARGSAHERHGAAVWSAKGARGPQRQLGGARRRVAVSKQDIAWVQTLSKGACALATPR